MKRLIKLSSVTLLLAMAILSLFGCGEMKLNYDERADGSFGVWFDGLGLSSRIDIPESFRGQPVTAIFSYGDYTHDLASITEITIPPSVRDVEKDTLSRLTNLKVKKNGVTYVAGWAVDCDEGISEVVIEEGTIGLAEGFLGNNGSAIKVTLPRGLKNISSRAFAGATNINEVEINEDLEYIGVSVFSGCRSLKSVNIPSSIDTVPCGLFVNCDALEKVIVPASVKGIYKDAFYSDSVVIYYEGSEEEFALVEELRCGCGYFPHPPSSLKKIYYSETMPEGDKENYWFYIDGQPVLWSEY